MAHFFDERVARPIVARFPQWLHPNYLSIFRAVLIVPVIIWRDIPPLAVGLVIFSSVVDIFDGPLARVRGQASEAGATLDAYSDKVFVLLAIFCACGARVDPRISFTIFAFEIVLAAMRPIKRWRNVTGKSNAWGAAKTWSQSFAISFVLSHRAALSALAPYVFCLAISFAALSLLGHVRDLFARNAAQS